MLSRWKSTVIGQIVLLLACTLLALGLEYAARFHPPLRLTGKNLLRGAAGAAYLLITIGALHAALSSFSRRYRSTLLDSSDELLAMSPAARLGSAIASSCGEELFLRGYLFAWLVWDSPALAYFSNALIAAALSFRRGRHPGACLVAAADALLACTIMSVHRSLTVNITARLLQSVLAAHALRSQRVRAALSAPKLSWRMLYDLTDPNRRAVRRV